MFAVPVSVLLVGLQKSRQPHFLLKTEGVEFAVCLSVRESTFLDMYYVLGACFELILVSLALDMASS
jgi:hypothetical protein